MKQLKSIMSMAFLGTAILYAGIGYAATDGRDAMEMDTAPGPAFATVDGKVTKIEGAVYTIQTESTGYQNLGSTSIFTETKIYVGRETKKLHGEKKVGDKVRAEVTRGGFANSIQ